MRRTIYRPALIGLLFLLVLFATGAVLKTQSWNTTTSSARADSSNQVVQNIRFTVYDVAMYPHEMEVDAGRVAIVFDDRTGSNSAFSVHRINGNSEEAVDQVKLRKDHWRTRGQLRLTPGRYRVFSVEKPEIQSLLIVNP